MSDFGEQVGAVAPLPHEAELAVLVNPLDGPLRGLGQLASSALRGEPADFTHAELDIAEGLLQDLGEVVKINRDFLDHRDDLTRSLGEIMANSAVNPMLLAEISEVDAVNDATAQVPQVADSATGGSVDEDAIDDSSEAKNGRGSSPEDGQGSPEDDEELFSSEETFVLTKLAAVEDDEPVGKSYFFPKDPNDVAEFVAIEERSSPGAYSQAFLIAMNNLIRQGLVEKPTRQTYILTHEARRAMGVTSVEEAAAFLDQ